MSKTIVGTKGLSIRSTVAVILALVLAISPLLYSSNGYADDAQSGVAASQEISDGLNASSINDAGVTDADVQGAIASSEEIQQATEGLEVSSVAVDYPEVSVMSVPERLAEKTTLDKAANKYEIAVNDASSIVSVCIDDKKLLPQSAGDNTPIEDVEWGVKDNDKLVFAEEVISALATKTHTLKVTFTDGEESTELKIENSAESREGGSLSGGAESSETEIAPLSQVGTDSKLTMKVGSGATWVDVDTIGNEVDWSVAENKQVQISAEFGSSTDRSILVEVPVGYKIVEYAATSSTPEISGVSKIGLSGDDEAKIASSVLTDLDGNDWTKYYVKGYTKLNSAGVEASERLYAGKILYTFNSNCDKITLTLTLGIQSKVISHAQSTLTLEPITTTLKSGSDTLETECSAKVSGITKLRASKGEDIKAVVEGYPANSVTAFTTAIAASFYSGVTDYEEVLAEEFSYKITYPEGISFVGFKDTIVGIDDADNSSGGSYALNTTGDTYHLTMENDESSRVLTITYSDVRLRGTMSFYWEVDVDQTNPAVTGVTVPNWDGSAINLTFPISEISYSSGEITNNSLDGVVADSSFLVQIMEPLVDINVSAKNIIRTDFNENSDYAYDYALGGFTVRNSGTDSAKNLTYYWTFSENLAVRAVTLPGLSGDNVSGAVAVVKDKTTGVTRTATVTDSITCTNTSVYNAGINLQPTIFGLNENEIILSLEVYQDTLSPGLMNSGRVGASTLYYGRFQNESTGDATLRITTADGYDSGIITDRTNIGWAHAGAGSVSTTAQSFDSETGTWGTGTWYPSSSLSFVSRYLAGNVIAHSNDVVDPVIIISMPKGITLDSSSVRAQSTAGNNGSSQVPLQLLSMETDVYDASTDMTYTVYRFSSATSYDMIAREPNMFNDNRSISVYFDATVSSTCGAMTLNAKDLVQWDLGQTGRNCSDGASYLCADTLDRSKHGNPSYNLVAGVNNGQFFVAQKPGLNVSLGIKEATSAGSYYTYDGTSATIASLSAGGQAEIFLSFTNTSTDDYVAGTEIYLPIPKGSVDYSEVFNNAANDPYNNVEPQDSEFDLSLTGPISLAGFDTLYTLDTSGAVANSSGFLPDTWTPVSYAWKTQAQMTAADYANVTMVKFVANQNIVSETTATSSGGIYTGSTTFTVEVSNTATLAQQDFWRSFQKGWKSSTGAGSWVYGSVLAAETSKQGIIGKVFNDANNNGIMDGSETPYDNTAGKVTAVLTGSTISPVTLTVAANGAITTPAGYSLRTGDYTITVINTDSVVDFTGTSANTAASERSDGTTWYMDIQQADVVSATNTGVFRFSIDGTSNLNPEYFGVGLTVKPVITYKAGTGVTGLADSSVSVKYGATASGAPSITASNAVAGYDYTAESWVFDANVQLKDLSGAGSTTVTAGTPLTRAELYRVVITADVVATVSLAKSNYAITVTVVDEATTGGTASASPASVQYNESSTVTATAPEGYMLDSMEVNGVAVTPALGTTSGVNVYTYTISSIQENQAVSVKFKAKPVYVTYMTGGDSSVQWTGHGNAAADESAYGATIAEAPDTEPTRTNYTFAGWKEVGEDIDWVFGDGTETTHTKLIASNGVVIDDADGALTLVAQWTLDTYSVSFVLDGGSLATETYGPLTLGVGETIVAATDFPADPEKEGYVFRGWVVSSVSITTDPWLTGASTMPAEDIVLTANWVPGTVIGEGNGIKIVASDFVMSMAEATAHQAMNSSDMMDDLIARGQVSAWRVDTLAEVNVTSIHVQPIAPSGEGIAAQAGDYRVTYEAVDGSYTASATVDASVFDNKEDDSGIAGNNFRWNVSGGALTEDQVRTFAKVTVFDEWGSATSENAALNASDLATLNNEIANLDYSSEKDVWVTFTSSAGNQVSIKVSIFRGAAPIVPGTPSISGNGFSWNVSGGSLSADQVRSYGNITVYDQWGNPTTEVASMAAGDLNRLNLGISLLAYGQTQVVSVTFVSSAGLSVTIPITLYRGAAPVPPVNPGNPNPVVPGSPNTPSGTDEPEAVEETTGTSDSTTSRSTRSTTSDDSTKKDTTAPKESNIDDGGVPLGGFDSNNHWSILSLILVIAGLAFSVGHLILGLRRKDAQKESGSTQAASSTVKASRGSKDSDALSNNDSKRNMTVARIITMVVGVVGVIALLVLEDFSLTSAWINQWTILFAVIFLAVVVGTLVHWLMSGNKKDDGPQQNRPSIQKGPQANA